MLTAPSGFERQNLFDELCNVGFLRRMLDDKIARQQLFVVWPLIDVFLQTHRDELLEGLGEFTGRQGWRFFGNHLLQLFERRAPGRVGELSGGHLDQ